MTEQNMIQNTTQEEINEQVMKAIDEGIIEFASEEKILDDFRDSINIETVFHLYERDFDKDACYNIILILMTIASKWAIVSGMNKKEYNALSKEIFSVMSKQRKEVKEDFDAEVDFINKECGEINEEASE